MMKVELHSENREREWNRRNGKKETENRNETVSKRKSPSNGCLNMCIIIWLHKRKSFLFSFFSLALLSLSPSLIVLSHSRVCTLTWSACFRSGTHTHTHAAHRALTDFIAFAWVISFYCTTWSKGFYVVVVFSSSSFCGGVHCSFVGWFFRFYRRRRFLHCIAPMPKVSDNLLSTIRKKTLGELMLSVLVNLPFE